MKYKEGDKVLIKDINWYNKNKDENGDISCGEFIFVSSMSKFCGKILTIDVVFEDGTYLMKEDTDGFVFTNEMFDTFAEEEVERLTGNLSNSLVNEFELPDGYIFKDQVGNEIHALKIVLEKANTLKTQSDNMETETHRGYCTTEPETTCEGKKRCVVYFWDNDFADKVELDLSNRELIQEDGKWFVVKKKKEYPKTYEECCEALEYIPHTDDIIGYKWDILQSLQKLLICRDAYWKIAGEEIGLGKPWEPDWNTSEPKYVIACTSNGIEKQWETTYCKGFAFPTAEMRDAFYENFKEEIEQCKELL